MLAHRQFGLGSLPALSNPNEMNKITKWSLLSTGLVALSLSTWHCAAPKKVAAPITLIGSLDASSSNRERLPASLVRMAELSSSIPAGSSVTLYRIDSRCQEIFNGPAPSFMEEFAARLTPRLREVAKEDNTYLHILGRAITTRLKSATGQVVIFIDTDYFCEGMTVADHKELSSHVTRWAKDSRVIYIVAAQVNPKRMEAVRADFAGAGSKSILTPDEVQLEALPLLARGGAK